MVEVQHEQSGLEFGPSPVPLSRHRAEVEALISQGSVEKARLRLEEVARQADATRDAAENLWLYSWLGQVYVALNDGERACDAFAKAYAIDPREQEVAATYSELLEAQGQHREALQVAQVVLLNHKQGLEAGEVAALYDRIGALREALGDHKEARAAFEMALVEAPEDKQALTGLLRAVGELGDPADVVEARLKLIQGLDDDRARSMALVALGDDWVKTFNDPERALDTFEEAVAQWPQNRHAVERIAEVARELGDFRRVCRAYFTLSVIAESHPEKAEYLIRSSDVARTELWESEKALAGYRKALEYDSTRLDAFKSVTSILVDALDWEELEAAYVQVIAANSERDDVDPNLLGVLWQKLGDLYRDHLDRADDAIFAFNQALAYLPDHAGLRSQLVELTEEHPEHYETAVAHLRAMGQTPGVQPGQWLDRLGKVFLRQKEVDKAYCVYRALRASGVRLDAKALGFVERFDSKILKPIRGQINPAMMRRFIFAPGLESELNECFRLLKGPLQEWTGEARSTYGLKRRDRVKLSENVAFNNFYKNVGAALGYVELPDLWRKDDQVGLVNGAMIPEGLIVGGDLLASAREKHIAFVVAKQLFLFLDPFYLAAIRPQSDLEAFLYRAVALVRPEVDYAASFQNEDAFKVMKRAFRGEEMGKLKRVIEEMLQGRDEIALGPWVEAIENTANRIGLIFCDDLSVAEACLKEEPRCISQRSLESRMRSLIDYSVSEQYLSLRPQLGIQVA
ncbi:hypothetical protein FRC96_16975 [Lujinxingia vulgaris]|uniref:Uncharacterized protein n=1 Tax=Lujinxingia vulgaris TaxID=2600176 RepID=A0A5C6X1G3_9DELT|nr:hypothetical protein [Lujinxingia vulgaris]TXD32604.1 hypothetical protein FRC96_16975 [Lujinxingia vulgaris]